MNTEHEILFSFFINNKQLGYEYLFGEDGVYDAWYDNHKSDADTYRGYWSFETAAIAISLGMSDDDFRGV